MMMMMIMRRRRRRRRRIHNIKIHMENKHQNTCWCITRLTAMLHTITSKLFIGEQNITE